MKFTVFIRVQEDTISDISFIVFDSEEAIASGDLTARYIKGKSVETAMQIIDNQGVGGEPTFADFGQASSTLALPRSKKRLKIT